MTYLNKSFQGNKKQYNKKVHLDATERFRGVFQVRAKHLLYSVN